MGATIGIITCAVIIPCAFVLVPVCVTKQLPPEIKISPKLHSRIITEPFTGNLKQEFYYK